MTQEFSEQFKHSLENVMGQMYSILLKEVKKNNSPENYRAGYDKGYADGKQKALECFPMWKINPKDDYLEQTSLVGCGEFGMRVLHRGQLIKEGWKYIPIRALKRLLTEIETTEETQSDEEYVDLGLPSGTLWATCNVGANKPEEYGEYLSYEKAINLPDTEVPTEEEFKELREKCVWVWAKENGIKGMMVIGPNKNSIFLPAAGGYNDTNLNNVGSNGYYWSSSLCSYDQNSACRTCFYSDGVCRYDCLCSYEQSVRPVKRKEK